MLVTRRDPMERFFNEMFRSPFMSGNADTTGTTKLMKTDIREHEHGYTLEVELPGFSRENIQAELKDGYLTITASKTEESESNAEGKYLRRERFQGTCKRSFYVGEYANEENVKAAYNNGVLKLEIPKEPEVVPEAPKRIAID